LFGEVVSAQHRGGRKERPDKKVKETTTKEPATFEQDRRLKRQEFEHGLLLREVDALVSDLRDRGLFASDSAARKEANAFVMADTLLAAAKSVYYPARFEPKAEPKKGQDEER
jgi:hypothetical protein